MSTEWQARLLCGLVAGGAWLAPVAGAQGLLGPSAYPTRESDWPGEGAVRLFEHMQHNRMAFWSRRSVDRHAIVFFGDSLTGGWTSLHRDFPGAKVVNRGIGGDVTRGMLFRFQQDVVDLAPRSVVILAGSADLSAQQPPEMAVRNIQRMLALLRAAGGLTPVILCTVPPRDNPAAPVDPRQLDRLNEGLRALAASTPDVQLLDLHALMSEAGAPRPALFAADRLHLSPAGYEVWRQALAPLLARAQAPDAANPSPPRSTP